MEKWLQHVKDNEETIAFWIERNEKLQLSDDMLQPMIEPFLKEFPFHNLRSCNDCIIDMLRWARIELRKYEQGLQPNKKVNKGSN